MPQGDHVQSVYLGAATGVINGSRGSGDKLFLEMSTIETSITREVGKRIMDTGFGTYVDSPVSVAFCFGLGKANVRVVSLEPKKGVYHLSLDMLLIRL